MFCATDRHRKKQSPDESQKYILKEAYYLRSIKKLTLCALGGPWKNIKKFAFYSNGGLWKVFLKHA